MALEITHTCQMTYSLPAAGGLFDQDAFLVYLMQNVLAGEGERAEIERLQKEAESGSKFT